MSRPELKKQKSTRIARPIVPVLAALAGAADPARGVVLNPLFARGFTALDVRRYTRAYPDTAEGGSPAKQQSQPSPDCLARDNAPQRHHRVITLLDIILSRSPV